MGQSCLISPDGGNDAAVYGVLAWLEGVRISQGTADYAAGAAQKKMIRAAYTRGFRTRTRIALTSDIRHKWDLGVQIGELLSHPGF
jgi:hypothetical protein